MFLTNSWLSDPTALLGKRNIKVHSCYGSWVSTHHDLRKTLYNLAHAMSTFSFNTNYESGLSSSVLNLPLLTFKIERCQVNDCHLVSFIY